MLYDKRKNESFIFNNTYVDGCTRIHEDKHITPELGCNQIEFNYNITNKLRVNAVVVLCMCVS